MPLYHPSTIGLARLLIARRRVEEMADMFVEGIVYPGELLCFHLDGIYTWPTDGIWNNERISSMGL
jgi:hypothetical protein